MQDPVHVKSSSARAARGFMLTTKLKSTALRDLKLATNVREKKKLILEKQPQH